ncbi:PKD domain-containing protein [Solitalea lacus]|uniref:PKD domain-containing protein n=1 Tax=Solitalea lacus TaxID=2911172 RepID=UPI001EDBFB7F|nr:hypothetical protein [Solitalea lacus]UKJ08649.1 hypothetical protein L2B55_05640 [Solitalea lacus]
MNESFFKWYLLAIVVSMAFGSCSDDTDMSQTFDIPPLDSSRKTKVNVNYPPTVSAGDDLITVLPDDTVTLEGTFYDEQEKRGQYRWTQLEGPSAATIEKPDEIAVTITNLVSGIYKFEFEGKDSSGLTGKDTVTVNVIEESLFKNKVVFNKISFDCNDRPGGGSSYCVGIITNIYETIPQNQPILVFVSIKSNWQELKNEYFYWANFSKPTSMLYMINDNGDLYIMVDNSSEGNVIVFY